MGITRCFFLWNAAPFVQVLRANFQVKLLRWNGKLLRRRLRQDRQFPGPEATGLGQSGDEKRASGRHGIARFRSGRRSAIIPKRSIHSFVANDRFAQRSLPGGRCLTQRQHARVANRQTLRHVCHDAIRSDRRGSEWRGSGFGTNAKCRGIQPLFRFLGRPSRRPEDSVREESLVARVLPN
jgi:hypothetical protein